MGRVSIDTGMRRKAGALPTGTVTFLLADVEGSSRLWEAGAEAMSASMARLNQLTDEVIARHGGARPVEQGEGDSFLAAFPRASDAVNCALDLQLALVEADWPGPAISVRMGLHTGEARLRDEGRNYAGEAVNRGARLRNLGHGGQTLLSRATYELVVERLPEGASLQDLGPHRLRDLQRPEHVWQLCHDALPDDFPRLRSLEAMPNNLPAQLTSFVGRSREIAEVRGFLREHRIVTLTGSGGVGKTRLAIETGADLLDEYPDGVWWVDLSSVNAPGLVPKSVATAANVREVPTRTTTDTLLRELRDSSVLILLDNCEHLTEACAELAEHLLRGCPRVCVLATSREPLGVPGELPWRVPSLALPDDEASIADADAVRLFRERAVSSRPNFRVTKENAAAVADICRQLEGIPLAIELAAARVRVLTPKQIAAGLSDRFHLLTGGGPRALPRQRTLEASVDWSYNLLSDEERLLLRRLSVFAGGFTLDAAEAVCADEDVDAYRVLDLLTALVDRSLAQMDDDTDQARYWLLETIRQYAAQRLVDAGEGPALGDKHFAHYLELAERHPLDADPDGDLGWFVAMLETEHDNLRAALDWALRNDRVDDALRLVIALAPFWQVRSHTREARRRLDAVLPTGAGDPSLRARALAWSALLAFGEYAINKGSLHADEALAIARQLCDARIEVRALVGVGLSRLMSDPAAARTTLEEALSLATELRDGYSEWYARQFLGWLDFQAGDLLSARRWFEGALAGARGTGMGPAGRMISLAFVGSVALYRGDNYEAERILEEALAIGRDNDVRIMLSLVLGSLGLVALWRGDSDRALARLEEMERLAERFGLVDINTMQYRAVLRGLRGDPAGAVTDLEDVSRVMEAMGFNWVVSMHAAILAFAALASGDREAVRRRLDEVAAAGQDAAIPYGLAMAAYVDGLLAATENEPGRAEDRHHEAIALGMECGLSWIVTLALEEIGVLFAAEGRLEDAARLFGFTDAARRTQGWVGRGWFFLFAGSGPSLDTTSIAIAAARERLGEEAFAKAWAEGAAMSPEEAVAYVQRGRGPRRRPSAGWSSLTPRELEVVRLVASGRTNPEIGEKLFLSKRTVQTHLSHIFAKVSVSTRAELASEATRREL